MMPCPTMVYVNLVLILAVTAYCKEYPSGSVYVSRNETFQLNCSKPFDHSIIEQIRSGFQCQSKDVQYKELYTQDNSQFLFSINATDLKFSKHVVWLCCCQTIPIGMADGQCKKWKITRGDMPHKPMLVKAELKNWERLDMCFKVRNNTNFLTQHHVFYSFNNGSSYSNCSLTDSNTCPDLKRTKFESFKCSISGDFLEEPLVTYKLFSSNLLQNGFSKNYTLETKKLVKPDPVNNLDVYQDDSKTLIISFQNPKPPKELHCNVSYLPKLALGIEQQPDTVLISKDQKQFTHSKFVLEPGMVYDVVVVCHSKHKKGFWSDEVKKTFKMEDDVPARNVPVIEGGYIIRDNKLSIFWKPLVFSNGNITEYRVQMNCGTFKKNESMPIDGRSSQKFTTELSIADLELPCTYFVEAKTSAGYNSTLRPKKVQVTRVFDSIQNITSVAHDQSVIMYWNSVKDADSYTLFWCKGSTAQKMCYDPPHSVTITANKSDFQQYEIHQLDPSLVNEYMFGVGATSFTGSNSGIQFSKCTFVTNGDTTLPSFDINPGQHDITISLIPNQQCLFLEYTSRYTVKICDIETLESCDLRPCPDGTEERTASTTTILHDLKAGQSYRVEVTAHYSPRPKQRLVTHHKCVYTNKDTDNDKSIVILVVIILVIVVIMVLIVGCKRRTFLQYVMLLKERYMKPVVIDVPQTPNHQMIYGYYIKPDDDSDGQLFTPLNIQDEESQSPENTSNSIPMLGGPDDPYNCNKPPRSDEIDSQSPEDTSYSIPRLGGPDDPYNCNKPPRSGKIDSQSPENMSTSASNNHSSEKSFHGYLFKSNSNHDPLSFGKEAEHEILDYSKVTIEAPETEFNSSDIEEYSSTFWLPERPLPDNKLEVELDENISSEEDKNAISNATPPSVCSVDQNIDCHKERFPSAKDSSYTESSLIPEHKSCLDATNDTNRSSEPDERDTCYSTYNVGAPSLEEDFDLDNCSTTII